MTQIFHHYKKWEDYHNGMFRKVNAIDDHFLIGKAVELLSNQDICYQAMKRVVNEWKYSSEHNLTNISQNRRAWLGQAACCIEFGVPEELTRIAWSSMSVDKQDKANAIADIVIQEWEESYAKKVS